MRQPRAAPTRPTPRSTWLDAEGYDVTALEPPEVLGPYLANGLNLIAFRLTKGSTTPARSARS